MVLVERTGVRTMLIVFCCVRSLCWYMYIGSAFSPKCLTKFYTTLRLFWVYHRLCAHIQTKVSFFFLQKIEIHRFKLPILFFLYFMTINSISM